MRDAQMDALIRKMLSARARGVPEGCPDENIMSAYLESSLTPQEMNEFESHVADCSACREILALSMRIWQPETQASALPAGAPKKILFRFSIPIPVLGAVILAAILIPVVLRFLRHSGRGPETQIAEVPSARQEMTRPAGPAALPSAPRTAKDLGRETIPVKPRVAEKKAELYQRDQKGTTADSARMLKKVPEGQDQIASAVGTLKEEAEMPENAPKPDEGKKFAGAPVPPPARSQNSPAAVLPSMQLEQMNRFRDTAVLNSVPPNNILFGSETDGDLHKAAELKQVGDKVFYLNRGVWIDRESAEHRGTPVIEILSAVPEHGSILSKYPGLRDLLPAVIYWNKTNYLLRPSTTK